jgi:hypothetical protein
VEGTTEVKPLDCVLTESDDEPWRPVA